MILYLKSIIEVDSSTAAKLSVEAVPLGPGQGAGLVVLQVREDINAGVLASEAQGKELNNGNWPLVSRSVQ